MNSRPRRQNKHNSGKTSQLELANRLDELAAFEEFKADILPMLKKALKEGWKPQKIYEFAAAHAAARSVTIALTEEDSAKALSGIKEILDRSGGKATERKEIKHELSTLADEELDSLLQSKLASQDEDEVAH